MPLTIAIVGRPNVGKSTLFNRLAERHRALVHPEPGVTRDRIEGAARIGHLEFTAIDTAGFRFADVTDIHSPDFLPGGAKYGDLPGMLSLSAPIPRAPALSPADPAPDRGRCGPLPDPRPGPARA